MRPGGRRESPLRRTQRSHAARRKRLRRSCCGRRRRPAPSPRTVRGPHTPQRRRRGGRLRWKQAQSRTPGGGTGRSEALIGRLHQAGTWGGGKRRGAHPEPLRFRARSLQQLPGEGVDRGGGAACEGAHEWAGAVPRCGPQPGSVPRHEVRRSEGVKRGGELRSGREQRHGVTALCQDDVAPCGAHPEADRLLPLRGLRWSELQYPFLASCGVRSVGEEGAQIVPTRRHAPAGWFRKKVRTIDELSSSTISCGAGSPDEGRDARRTGVGEHGRPAARTT